MENTGRSGERREGRRDNGTARHWNPAESWEMPIVAAGMTAVMGTAMHYATGAPLEATLAAAAVGAAAGWVLVYIVHRDR